MSKLQKLKFSSMLLAEADEIEHELWSGHDARVRKGLNMAAEHLRKRAKMVKAKRI